jgi:hypothetical protein
VSLMFISQHRSRELSTSPHTYVTIFSHAPMAQRLMGVIGSSIHWVNPVLAIANQPLRRFVLYVYDMWVISQDSTQPLLKLQLCL